MLTNNQCIVSLLGLYCVVFVSAVFGFSSTANSADAGNTEVKQVAVSRSNANESKVTLLPASSFTEAENADHRRKYRAMAELGYVDEKATPIPKESWVKIRKKARAPTQNEERNTYWKSTVTFDESYRARYLGILIATEFHIIRVYAIDDDNIMLVDEVNIGAGRAGVRFPETIVNRNINGHPASFYTILDGEGNAQTLLEWASERKAFAISMLMPRFDDRLSNSVLALAENISQ